MNADEDAAMTMLLNDTTNTSQAPLFVPGDYWTPEVARRSVTAMRETLATPEMQDVLNRAGDEWQATHTGELQLPSTSPRLSGEGIKFRRARSEDVPELARVIMEAKLPPFFIEEFVGGFVFAEKDGRMIAAGGMEVYESCGFLRSIAVDEAARGLGLGRKIADLLHEDARASGLEQLYLYTQDAYMFWKHVGYADVPFDSWPVETHECWQHRFMMEHMDLVRAIGVHSMWRPV
jgi:amino-acid N-acetyltransferase